MRTCFCCSMVFVLLAMVLASPLWAEEIRVKEVEILLSRLDLERPGLEKVKAAAGDLKKAAHELLAYYRSRTSVKHPEVARGERAKLRGNCASKDDVEIAEDAVRNILITSPVYPRHDFGKKIDWFRNCNPKRDLEWIIQLHRHYSWGPLGRAYWHTGNEKYAETYCRQLADWLENCSSSKNMEGRPAWSVLEVGIRGHFWTGHFNHFLDSPHYTPGLLVRQLNSFYEHAHLLTTDRLFTRNNWGLMEAEGTAFIGVTFPEFKDAAAWRKKGFRHLAGQVGKQVLPDGMHVEMCFDYHRGSIGWLGRTFHLAQINGMADAFPTGYMKTIERMYEVLGLAAHPSGRHSMFGDDRSNLVIQHVRRGADEFANNVMLKFLATGGREGVAPPTALALSDAGIYSLRSGWGENAIHLIMKCGRDGGWHCQPDNGTFELYAFDRYLMPDSGCYIYHGDGRGWFRQTRVHQTMTLDDKDSAYEARLLLWQPGENLDAVVVENRSYENLTHRRAVLFVNKRFFILVDDAEGTARGTVDLHFQLAPGKAFWYKAAPAVRTDSSKSANVLIHAMKQDGMALEKEHGQVSPAYGKKEPRPAFRFRINKTADTSAARFVTLVVPYKASVPKVSVTQVATQPRQVGRRVELKVSVGEFSGIVAYDLDTGKAWLR